MVLKPSMVISGKKCPKQAPANEVAERTLVVLKRTVPAAVPGIAFLSGGQSEEVATEHLDAMNKLGGGPWTLSFSYGRALQAAALKSVGRQGGKRRRGAGGVPAPRADEQPRGDRQVLRRAGKAGGLSSA